MNPGINKIEFKLVEKAKIKCLIHYMIAKVRWFSKRTTRWVGHKKNPKKIVDCDNCEPYMRTRP